MTLIVFARIATRVNVDKIAYQLTANPEVVVPKRSGLDGLLAFLAACNTHRLAMPYILLLLLLLLIYMT